METRHHLSTYMKSDKLDSNKYRRINLLNTAYEIFANILYQRLLPLAEENIGGYQCSFRNDRSTTDQLFCLRHVLENYIEFNIVTLHLFVDFKKA